MSGSNPYPSNVSSVVGVWVIVVAAGSGTRFGGLKQFLPLGDSRVIDWAVRVATLAAEGVVIVVAADYAAEVTAKASGHRFTQPTHHSVHTSMTTDATNTKSGHPPETEPTEPSTPPNPTHTHPPTKVLVTAGGVTRSDSVRCGLALVPDNAEVILVHDGVRPLADIDIYRRVIASIRLGADVAVPVVDVVDTMRWRTGNTIDRTQLTAVQTPQGFRADVLRAAHTSCADFSDDASLAETIGATVVLVDGDRRNLKITEPLDLAIAETLLRKQGCADVNHSENNTGRSDNNTGNSGNNTHNTDSNDSNGDSE